MVVSEMWADAGLFGGYGISAFSYKHYLCVDRFSYTLTDVIHPLNPCHRVGGFELLSNAFIGSILIY